MPREVLITTGNGMFGRELARVLIGDERIHIRAMVRDRSKFILQGPNLDVVTGDMDRPESLIEAVKGVSHVFLTSPMDCKIADREMAVIDAAKNAGDPHILKLAGAVNHEGDTLNSLHVKSLGYLKSSGLKWTLISPNSVMETSLLPYADLLKWNCFFGMSGNGRVGLVALNDVALATKAVLLGDGHEGRDYKLTGPDALDLYDIAEIFSKVLGRKISYYDLSEEELKKMLLKYGPTKSEVDLEMGLLCHLRAWQSGGADLVTNTFLELTGQVPTSAEQWIKRHREEFNAGHGIFNDLVGVVMGMQYGHHARKKRLG